MQVFNGRHTVAPTFLTDGPVSVMLGGDDPTSGVEWATRIKVSIVLESGNATLAFYATPEQCRVVAVDLLAVADMFNDGPLADAFFVQHMPTKAPAFSDKPPFMPQFAAREMGVL